VTLFDTIFCDLDGVLLDLRRDAFMHFDASIGPNDNPSYDLGEIVGVSNNAFWKKINALGPNFWRHMTEYHWCQDLIDHLRVLSRRMIFVTAPTLDASCLTGKYLWFQDRFGRSFNDFVFTRQKELLARTPNSVLIDDCLENVEAWRAAGGDSILFPQVWNGNVCPDDPVKYVVRALESLARSR
jgi:hypothetical protein